MDLTLVAILYTGLFALSLQATLNSGTAGPAGRRQQLPRYQRRVLVGLTVIALCVVVDAYLLARTQAAPRPEQRGLLWFDVLAIAGVLLTWVCVRRDATRNLVRWIGIGLGTYAFGVTAVWTLLAFAWSDAAGGAFQSIVAHAWGTSPAVVGFIALFHYLLAPALFAAGTAAHDAWPRRDTWDRDRALQPLALLMGVMAVGYVIFTWCVVF